MLIFGGQILEVGKAQAFFRAIYTLSPYNGHWVEITPETMADFADLRSVYHWWRF